MSARKATKVEAESIAHRLSEQPWMPAAEWVVIERDDRSAYVRAYVTSSAGRDIERFDALTGLLGGRYRRGDGVTGTSWHGSYGHISVCISVPPRTHTTVSPARPATNLPLLDPCPADRLRAALLAVEQWADGAGLDEEQRAALVLILDEVKEPEAAG